MDKECDGNKNMYLVERSLVAVVGQARRRFNFEDGCLSSAEIKRKKSAKNQVHLH